MKTQDEEDLYVQWFEKHYVCSECGKKWSDEWSCECDDRCPSCNCEIEPTAVTDLSRPLAREDYVAAARKLKGSSEVTGDEVSAVQAQQYAQAILEGGEHRLPHDWFSASR
jgi:hypothetical protein